MAESNNQKVYPQVRIDKESFLFNNRILYLKGEIQSENSNIFDETTDIITSLFILDSISHSTITLYIDSAGGDVYTGLALYDVIRSLKSPVVTVGMGLVASIAVIVFVAGEKRYVYPNSRIFIHEPWRWTSEREDASKLEVEACEIGVLKTRIQEILVERTGQKLERIKKDTDRNKYFSSLEAKKYGIVHEIIRVKNGKHGKNVK